MNLKIKTRLTLWFVTLTAVILAMWSALTITLVYRDLYGALDRTLTTRAAEIVNDLGSSREGGFTDAAEPSIPGLRPGEVATQLLSADGVVLESAGTTASLSPMIPASEAARLAVSGSSTLRTLTLEGERFRLLAVRAGAKDQVLVVAGSTHQADNALTSLIFVLLITGPAVLTIAAIGGRWLAGKALAPVADMTATAADIGADRLDERIPVPPGDDELTRLASTLNSMLTRLEADVQDKRRLVADASHELQTPLAVMRTEIDVALAAGGLPGDAIEVLESAREETDRMTQIVRNLLTLARFDEGTLRLLRGPLDLHAVAEEVAGSVENLAAETDVTLTVSGGVAIADADGEYIRQVVLNLVENAIKYSGRGHSVTIATRTSPGFAVIDVADDGPGIPTEALDRVFDRFYRIESSRSRARGGSGLGLAISREVVQAHGGRIDVTSTPGQGSTFTVLLPSGD